MGWLAVGVGGVGGVSAVTADGPAPLQVAGAVAAVGVYGAVMRRVARRTTPETARRGAVREALLGGGTGLGFVLASVALIAAFGGFSFAWAGRDVLPVVGSAIGASVGAAVIEELLFRGLALQALEQLYGARTALVVTALLFGGLHLANPGATAWSSLAIGLQAGVLLGAAFLWRRSIWFVAGLHFAWNATEQLLGVPVSGYPAAGLLTTDVTGPVLLTGGGFGLEASVVPVVVSVLLTVPMLALAHRRDGLLARRRGAV
ncbi:CPBP family intramembrane glutamic endopeptidase [Streptomyces sp. MST-110588]|uniref:CPBP family intramembrane glutamic endopeptidase n=1 Tax=Streptomyces sp. MST-110588 TaxID=2833628 RepID=UPI001F5CE835|nr:CPBP family intramembrane glutamic endopeptidase [Streptomyces sp. MST-110588]UNO39472.1 CPBP family intramembrane metalloprotease [Streptomyces sp. MST-110588]